MTDLGVKTVRRRVFDLRGNALVVSLTPEGLRVREPRRRGAGYLLPYGMAFLQAVKLQVDAERREKLAARKANKATARRR